jgi:predicted DNA-binding WGR domain protein
MPRLVFHEGASHKFWDARCDGKKLIVRFGKVGTEGQEQEKAFPTAAAASAELAKREGEKRAAGYVDEEAKSPAKKGTKKAEHPFLFYGRVPGDWFEGSNNGYLFELRFAAPLAAAQRKSAETAFRNSAKKSETISVETPWMFSNEWATFFVGDRYLDWEEEHGDSIGFHDQLWDDLAEALLAVHRAVPLVQAQNRNARGPYAKRDAWSAWSVKQQKSPVPSPIDPFAKRK